MKKSPFFALITLVSIIFSAYPAYGATVFYANGAFTKNGIEWCEENKPLYDLLGDEFFEHHKHSIESRVCANLIEDPLWSYSGPDRVEKLIEQSRYFSELEIAESREEAKVGVVDPTPAQVPGNKTEEKIEESVEKQIEQLAKEQVEETPKQNEVQDVNEDGGGCLIATAAYGSELSTNVQMLREVRDTQIMNTQVGAMFLSGFNQFYYSFSPTIADMERQSPAFKEFVKITITPLLTTLSLLNHVDINSEGEMIGWGIGILSLNAGFYFGIPFFVAIKLKRNLLS
ncbi:MAG: Ig family protein [Thaumarchaeota archaeon CSP1-1]|nr:MAG: Ig family protein [Thaumarchaeota archaeon CSP1-1]